MSADNQPCLNADVESLSSLSAVLETGSLPQRFFLSPKACAGILRRAERKNKQLPPALRSALTEAIQKGAGGTEDK
jgi:hypothetical protein